MTVYEGFGHAMLRSDHDQQIIPMQQHEGFRRAEEDFAPIGKI
jgi:hypothetical protein